MNAIPKYICILFALSAMNISVFASDRLNPHLMQNLVRDFFGADENAGFFAKTTDGTFVEVCGDSCSFFRWVGDPNDDRFWQFIVLFEIKDNPGTDVARFSRAVKALNAESAIDGRFCKIQGGDLFSISCDWHAYSKSLGIFGGHSKYDEGNRCYSRIVDWQKMSMTKWTCAKAKPSESPFK